MIGRAAAVAAIVVVLVGVGAILFGGGSSYQVRAIFTNASQIVTGDQVQVAGNAIGSVSDIVTKSPISISAMSGNSCNALTAASETEPVEPAT